MGAKESCCLPSTADQVLEISEVTSPCNDADFDWTKSTEENYKIPHFVGTHADLRPFLDYTWHCKYKPSRVHLQDALIDKLCKSDPRNDGMLPWVVFTAGAMGAGKGFVVRWLAENSHMPVECFVTVDPDQIRTMLPEWQEYVKRDAEKAGDLTQKEAGCVAELLGYRALRDHSNIIIDGSLRNAEWYTEYFRSLRKNYPGIRIMILHIFANIDEVLARAKARGEKTGRVVPEQKLRESAEAVPAAVQALAPHTDVTLRINNFGNQPPTLEREPGAPRPGPRINVDWTYFRSLWKDIDENGDGELSREELQYAKEAGLIHDETIKRLDKDGDGHITKEEFVSAQKSAAKRLSLKGWR